MAKSPCGQGHLQMESSLKICFRIEGNDDTPVTSFIIYFNLSSLYQHLGIWTFAKKYRKLRNVENR